MPKFKPKNPDEENSYYISQKLVATWYLKKYKEDYMDKHDK